MERSACISVCIRVYRCVYQQSLSEYMYSVLYSVCIVQVYNIIRTRYMYQIGCVNTMYRHTYSDAYPRPRIATYSHPRTGYTIDTL